MILNTFIIILGILLAPIIVYSFYLLIYYILKIYGMWINFIFKKLFKIDLLDIELW